MIEKAKAATPKQAEYVYVLQLTADHQGSKSFLKTFGRLDPIFLKRCYRTTTI